MWRRWGTPQNFCLVLLMNLKYNYLLKKLLKQANKRCKNFNIYIVVIFKKIKKNTWRYHYFTIVYENHDRMMYVSWDMECDRHNFLSFWAVFCTVTSLLIPQINICKKYKKPLDIFFYTCVTEMKIIWWDIRHGRQSFISLWTIFCTFTLLTTWKKCPEMLSFYTCVPQIAIISCMVPEIWSMVDRISLSFWTIFCPFTP